MNFCVIAEGRGTLASAALAAALPRLQARHPLLGVAIAADDTRQLCFQPMAAPPTLTVCQSTEQDWRSQLAQAIAAPFTLGTAPLFRAAAYMLPDEHWVLGLIFHHSIADARSGFAVMREALRLAAGGSVDLTPIPPRAPLLSLYPAAWANTAGEQAAAALKAIKRDEHRALSPSEMLPGYQELPALESPAFVSLRYGADLVTRLGHRARSEHTTVHGVIGAAQLLALRLQIEGSGDKTLGLTTPADLRATLETAMDADTPGFYVTLLAPVFAVGDVAHFWPLARAISTRNREMLTRGDGHLFYHFFPPAESFSPDAAGQAAFDEMMRRGPQASALSNVGRLPALGGLGNITVDQMSFSLFPAPKQPLFTSATTYDDVLTLNLNYDRLRLPEPLLRQIVHSLDHLLRQAASDD